jgi:hypothetical protein
MGEKRNAIRMLVGKPEGKNHLEKLGVVVKMMINGSERDRLGIVDCNDLAHDKDQGRELVVGNEHFWVRYNAGNFSPPSRITVSHVRVLNL